MTTSSANPVADLSYEDAINELETIVNELDAANTDIDSLSTKFARAIEIIENLDGRINKARKQVDDLAPRLEKIGEQNSPQGND